MGQGYGGRRAEKDAEGRIRLHEVKRGREIAMARENIADARLVYIGEQRRQMPQADKRRRAVAMRAARPEQQREKKALAMLDFALMRAGRARFRRGEQRNGPASAVSQGVISQRGKTRQTVRDQAEIDQRDGRALPGRSDPAGMIGADSAAGRDPVHQIAFEIAVIEKRPSQRSSAPSALTQTGQPSPVSAASRSPSPAAGSRAPVPATQQSSRGRTAASRERRPACRHASRLSPGPGRQVG